MPNQIKDISVYRNGGDGFIQWCEDFLYIPLTPPGKLIPEWVPMHSLPDDLDPETGRSFQDFWDEQKYVLRQALQMDENGRFLHRLIIFCWPRGEGKSAVVVLIQLWKFFCWPKQMIVLGANSKDQTKFVHFDIMRDTILNSPRLVKILGKKNIQEKEIRMKNRKGETVSFIRPISSFSGIVSNITGYTFSEIFDMKNPKFYTQLDGSIRNIPNALGTIDSTVSEKNHILYKLYETYKSGEDPSLFFHYRYSLNGHYKDYWHPNMTQKQLSSYRSKFLPEDFRRYFLNTWSVGVGKLFTVPMIESLGYIGIDGMLGGEAQIQQALHKKYELGQTIEGLKNKHQDTMKEDSQVREILRRLIPIEEIYSLKDGFGIPTMASAHDLKQLSDRYDTDFAISVGIDRADPTKKDMEVGARTMIVAVAKGLPGSKSTKFETNERSGAPNYVYFILNVCHVETSTLEDIKLELQRMRDEYGTIETICSERWAMFDLEPWCDENGIKYELVHPSYEKQKTAFTEVFNLYKTGRIKCPEVVVPGTKGPNILYEEAQMLDHDAHKKFYGSPEKNTKNGIQDDTMYALAWCVFGGRTLTQDDFRPIGGSVYFGSFYSNESLPA